MRGTGFSTACTGSACCLFPVVTQAPTLDQLPPNHVVVATLELDLAA